MTVRNAASMPASFSRWERRGYHGSGNVQGLFGTLDGKTAIVCGNASGVFNQYDDMVARVPDAVVFACNDVGQYLPVVDHWVSLHHDKLRAWRDVRWQESHGYETTKYHSVDVRPYIDYAWEQLTPCFALSGYFAMQLAWIMGASRIVLCGCPGDARPRFFEAKARADFSYGGGPEGREAGVKNQLVSEMERVPGFKDAVRSVSGGFTQSYFGGIEL